MKFQIGNLKERHTIITSQVAISAVGLTMPTTPVVGNMLVALGFGYTTSPGINVGWTEITDARHDPVTLDPGIRAAWQLVSGTPSASVTPFTGNTGSDKLGLAVFEVAGLDATWTPTYERTDFTAPSAGGATQSVSRTTAHDNTLLLVAGFTETNSADPGAATITGTPSSWVFVGAAHTSNALGGYGVAGGYQRVQAASTAVTATYTPLNGNSAICMISVLPVI